MYVRGDKKKQREVSLYRVPNRINENNISENERDPKSSKLRNK